MARLDGRVVFVPRTTPGERVLLSTTGRSPEARLLQILEPGPGRVAPRCVHVAECEGCQWQHVAADVQGHAKRQTLIESLVRLGGVPRDGLADVPLFAAPNPFRYRRRARFTVQPGGALGYAGTGGRRSVAIRECHLLEPALERLALAVSRLLRGIVPRPSHVELCFGDDRGALRVEFARPMAQASLQSLGERLLAELPAVGGALLVAGSRTVEVGTLEVQDGGGFIRPDVFVQANRAMNATLVPEALARLDPAPGARVLELFAGSGNFTLPLAGRVRELVAVEREGQALKLLRRAIDAARAANILPVAGDAAEVCADLARSQQRFDAVLLDPPRAGAREVMPHLLALAPARIGYVACDPATLARDVGLLLAGGYRVKSAAVFDQFPQTYHLEAAVILER